MEQNAEDLNPRGMVKFAVTPLHGSTRRLSPGELKSRGKISFCVANVVVKGPCCSSTLRGRMEKRFVLGLICHTFTQHLHVVEKVQGIRCGCVVKC